ncbi:hypothetical protein LQZ24_03825 [Fructobacillus sp. M1-13]|uniref:ABC transporter permease n=1 Tax=Fructobacillus papyriferae TaxID=2713171 RepID=A0ABS5QQR1_9LACO|nr:hypothetical protein [Fructobacillus papyriferae]MBS9335177.1 hypothetical protein [Fructobacillus papyriferae]MCD2159154.1 hypothetical protein [Fructobacillus papyriferae]
MSAITIIDAIEHVIILGGISLAKVFWLNTFMASSVAGPYGHLLTTFLLGLFPVWLLLGVGFVVSTDFRSGQSYNLVSRVGIPTYIKSNYYAAAICGVLLYVIPLILNLIFVIVIQFINVRKSDCRMGMLQDRSRIPDLEKYHFLWWQLENPVLTFFIYLVLFLIVVVLVSMLLVSLTLILNQFFQVLTVVVLASVLLGSQLFNIGSLLQTFAYLQYASDWIQSWVIFIVALIGFNVAIYYWQRKGELQ